MFLKEQLTMRYWDLNPDPELQRADFIIRTLGRQFQGRILDVGCGTGELLYNIKSAIPGAECIGIDITDHTKEWSHWSANGLFYEVVDIMDKIKEEKKYDVVLMLNSFRNWNSESREKFVDWLDGHTTYFITSTNLPYMKSVIGKDLYNIDLELYSINNPLWKRKSKELTSGVA